MIQHIGLSNHIGLDKRFVVKTDKLQYKPDDRVRLTVQAYDAELRAARRPTSCPINI